MPALIGISMKLAIDAKRKGLSWFRVITSFVTGLGCAYLTADLVLEYFSPQISPIVIASIAMSGEHISDWIIYKLNIDQLAIGFLEWLLSKIKK